MTEMKNSGFLDFIKNKCCRILFQFSDNCSRQMRREITLLRTVGRFLSIAQVTHPSVAHALTRARPAYRRDSDCAPSHLLGGMNPDTEISFDLR